jgi:hypothetical protein
MTDLFEDEEFLDVGVGGLFWIVDFDGYERVHK